MADGPRCKRRKQANPKRSSVTNFNNGLEASSDSDDEDKLHIVEEESLQDPEVNADAARTTKKESHDAAAATAATAATTTTVLPLNGSWNGVKEECVSEEEDEDVEEEETVKDALVEEILQQGDTPIIYPEAPDDEQSPVEVGGADENGTPDTFPQLHTCPYCSRVYKRNASLKEHIKYRHETSDDNYSCSHCTYTFTYRSQLERHMSRHRDQSSSGLNGAARKFKCTECSKAFKYKHHLKEHLRIHSGEKPYECATCKKRFSHSGSYSSHISSKKCVAATSPPPNGITRTVIKPPLPTVTSRPVLIAPARVILKEKTDSKPLQEQLPVTQIKSEPVEYECKPVVAATATSAGTNGVVNGGSAATAAAPAAALPQGVAMVVPTMGLMSPISINLNDLQSVLKVAMDGNVLRQVLGGANGGAVASGKQGIVLQQAQQQIISLPAFVDHDGTTKIIINYSIGPAAGATAVTQPLVVKNNPPAAPTVTSATAAAPSPSSTGKPATPEVADLSIVKTEPESVAVSDEAAAHTKMDTLHSDTAHLPKANSTSTCLLCDDCPEHLEALHLLQHRKAANGEAVDSAALDPSFADLLSEAGVTLDEPPVEDLVSLLKSYFASNANPGQQELEKISETASIPVDVVRKWFAKMNAAKKSGKTGSVSKKTTISDNLKRNGSGSTSPSDSQSLNNGKLIVVKSEPEDPDDPAASQAEPLDLSIPKQLAAGRKIRIITPVVRQQEQPLNLTCLRKEQVDGRTIYVTTPQTAKAIKIVSATQLPRLVAIAGGQNSVGCLSAINTTNTTATKRTILIPQLTYSYASTPGKPSEAMTVVLNGHKEEKLADSSSDSVSAMDDQNDSDSQGLAKRRRLDNGVYPCDLCFKVFQKGSSLHRHKFEHTGERPHECNICQKAFKHKHHLIEHSRLHSGEKPYQCDKCGKRFSHSGSYSQHMNHRYTYCKKDGASAGPIPIAELREARMNSDGGQPLDSRTPSPPSQLDSSDRESGEEDEEDEEEEEEAMCMDDIRVVQVDDGECEIYEGNFDEDEEAEGEGLTEQEMEAEEAAAEEEMEEEVVEYEEEEEEAEEEAAAEEEMEAEEETMAEKDTEAVAEEEAGTVVEEETVAEAETVEKAEMVAEEEAETVAGEEAVAEEEAETVAEEKAETVAEEEAETVAGQEAVAEEETEAVAEEETEAEEEKETMAEEETVAEKEAVAEKETMAEEETVAEKEAVAEEGKDKELLCDVEPGDDHMREEVTEEEEKKEVTDDCEANTDKSIREEAESDGATPTEGEEVVTNAK